MDFCNDGSGPGSSGFVSSVLGSGGQDPSIGGWGAQRVNLSMADVQQTIQEGRLIGTGIWGIDGNPMIAQNT
jgi:hypothetical protein